MNVLDEISPELPRLADSRKAIKLRESENAKRKKTSSVLTVYEPVQRIDASKEAATTPITKTMTTFKDLSYSTLSYVYVKENAENDRVIQKVIQLVQNRNNAVIDRLPPPWRKRLNSFALDSYGLLYMDHRLFIPTDMRENVLGSFRSRGERLYATRRYRNLVAPHSLGNC